MSLLRMTVVSVDNDTTKAGTVLFNSKFIERARTLSATRTVFHYRENVKGRITKKVIVSDALGTLTDIYKAYAVGKSTTYQETFAIVKVRDSINDSTSDTTNKTIDLEDIVKGIELPSDTSQSLLWIVDAKKKVTKMLVDKFLKAFSDQASTGTTTTYE